MSIDHLILNKDTCKCLHCGYQYRINLPAPIGIFDGIVKQFIKLHRWCKKPKGLIEHELHAYPH